MAARTPSVALLRRLRRLRLWPIKHTRAYYRRVAGCNRLSLLQAVLLELADRRRAQP